MTMTAVKFLSDPKKKKVKKKVFCIFVCVELSHGSTQERSNELALHVELCLVLMCSSALHVKCVTETHLINRQQIKLRK